MQDAVGAGALCAEGRKHRIITGWGNCKQHDTHVTGRERVGPEVESVPMARRLNLSV